MSGFICGPAIYEFEGWRFEYGIASGPWPHRKDGELYKRAGKKFYDMFERWCSEDDPESYRIGGGCERL